MKSTAFENLEKIAEQLAEVARMIGADLDKYKGSCITKTWSNGNFENLGEINLKGANKTFVANTRQKRPNYGSFRKEAPEPIPTISRMSSKWETKYW